MAEITAAAVKALREKTDLPMMECKKALVKAEGNEEKITEFKLNNISCAQSQYNTNIIR